MRISDWIQTCALPILRKRAQMKLKIKAMSSESKASAYIIGALPFIVFGLICYINYGYMAPFFTGDPMGLFGLGLMQLVGIGGLCWMSIGAFIMAQMKAQIGRAHV